MNSRIDGWPASVWDVLASDRHLHYISVLLRRTRVDQGTLVVYCTTSGPVPVGQAQLASLLLLEPAVFTSAHGTLDGSAQFIEECHQDSKWRWLLFHIY